MSLTARLQPLPDELAEHLTRRRPVRRWWFRPTEHHLIVDLDRRITALEDAVRRLDGSDGNE